jgi:hypothetical protein
MRLNLKNWLVFAMFLPLAGGLLAACSPVNLPEPVAVLASVPPSETPLRSAAFTPVLTPPASPGPTTPVAEVPQAISSPTVVVEIPAPVIPTLTSQASRPTWWKPLPGLRWQWQLSAPPVDLRLDVDVYDIDLFDNDARVVTALHAQGRKVVCYLSAGSRENWRPDQKEFPAAVIGADYQGWPGENWLDIRQIELLAPVMRARLDLCKNKGFDGIEPDNIDGYTNETGFPLTYEDQVRYNLWLANEAHARGLSIGLKNDQDQVKDLLPSFDWALTEDCFAEEWCDQMKPFIQKGKPVFAAEYTDKGVEIEELCHAPGLPSFSFILKNRELDSWRQACP